MAIIDQSLQASKQGSPNKEIIKYLECLKDIKVRMNLTSKILTEDINKIPLILVVENCSLQLRIILELIALSSIIANKEEYSRLRNNFAKHWNGKRILEDVEKVNPDFYPKPSKQIINPSTGKVERIEEIKGNFLDKVSYIEAYDFTSDYLHAHNVYQPPLQHKNALKRLQDYISRIYILLNHYTIQLPHSDKQWWILMETKDGEIQVAEMEKQKKE